MTIVSVNALEPHELQQLGDNLAAEADLDHHECAIQRSLEVHGIAPVEFLLID